VLYSGEHLSAEAIIRQLEDRGERVGTATVYRTLDLLVQSGVARAHDFGEGFRRYEAMTSQDDHEHLVCIRCGRVEEFTNERLERMLPVIADEHHFQHQRHRVEIFGLCQSCQRLDLGGLA
jgi:Fur family ferric uptake transcriptional regulator